MSLVEAHRFSKEQLLRQLRRLGEIAEQAGMKTLAGDIAPLGVPAGKTTTPPDWTSYDVSPTRALTCPSTR